MFVEYQLLWISLLSWSTKIMFHWSAISTFWIDMIHGQRFTYPYPVIFVESTKIDTHEYQWNHIFTYIYVCTIVCNILHWNIFLHGRFWMLNIPSLLSYFPPGTKAKNGKAGLTLCWPSTKSENVNDFFNVQYISYVFSDIIGKIYMIILHFQVTLS